MIASTFGFTPKIAESAWIAPTATVIGDVTIGENVSLWFNAVVRGDVNKITIGDYTNVQDGTVIHVAHEKYPTHIGARVTIGHNALVHACIVGDDCLIGMGSIIMDGAEIGAGSIVGAGAVVTGGKKFPPNSLILGAPVAKVVRELRPEEHAAIEQSWRNYHEFTERYKRTFRVIG